MESTNSTLNIELLELNSHLKKVIYRAKTTSDLLLNTCNTLANNNIFDTSAIISTIDNNHTRFHSEHNERYLLKEEPPHCFNNALNSSKIIELQNNKKKCSYCEIQCKTPSAFTFARSLRFEETEYGVLIITSDLSFDYIIKLKKLICEIADDIAFAIHNILIKEELLLNKKAYEKSERSFKTIFDKAPVGISILNSNGIITDVNSSECRLLNYKKEELIGEHISIHFLPKYIPIFKKNFLEVIGKGTKEAIVELQRKDGSIFIAKRFAKAIYNNKGSIDRIIIHTQDISVAQESINKLHALSQAIDQSPSVFVISDIDNNITYVNKKFEEITGYNFKEVIGLNPRILKSNNQPHEFYRGIWNSLSRNEAWTGRFHNKRLDGSPYWELAKISKLYDKDKKHIGYIKTGEDITKIVDIEEKLEQSNQSYLSIFDMTPTPIIIHNGKNIININKATIDFANGNDNKRKKIHKKELLGLPISRFIHPASKKTIAKRINQMLNQEEVPQEEELFYNYHKEIRNVDVSSRLITYQGEKVFMVAFNDITERIEKTKKLLESEYKFHEIFNTNPDAISITNLSNGEFFEVNTGFTNLTGYKHSEIIGKTVYDLNVYHDINDREIILKTLQEKGKIDNLEMNFRIKNNEYITGLISARVITINNEKYVLFVVRDISQRKQMEEELLKAKNKAEENDRLKSAFLANMSHEIRNPMNAIIGFSDLLKDDDITIDERNSFIDIIQSKGNDLLVIIKDIIDISKVEAGVLEINCKPESLNSLINEVEAIYSPIFANIVDVSFIVKRNNSIDNSLTINVDTSRFYQIINNLIDNAIKFTEAGEIKLIVNTTDKDISITISDTGIGITKENIEIIFQRFIQIDNTLKKLDSGSGLGLCITRSLVDMMNGEISANSKVGVGSEFTFTLPIATDSKSLNCNN